MSKPMILTSLPTTDPKRPLIARDDGWYAESSSTDPDTPIVEYLGGGFLDLLKEHGMDERGNVEGSSGGGASTSAVIVNFGTLDGMTNHEGGDVTVGDVTKKFTMGGVNTVEEVFNEGTDDELRGYKFLGSSADLKFDFGFGNKDHTAKLDVTYLTVDGDGKQTLHTETIEGKSGFSGSVMCICVNITGHDAYLISMEVSELK